MKAIVIGATGATGKELVQLLLDSSQFKEVIALVARPKLSPHDKLKQIVVDFSNLDDWKDYIQGDVAFSCLGTTLKTAGSKEAQWIVDHDYQYNFARICEEQNINTFVLLSSTNANVKSAFFYSKMKGETEQDVESLLFERLIIVRPGMLDRPNSDRLGEKIVCSLIKSFNKVGLMRKSTPTKVSDLAYVLLESTKIFNNNVNIISSNQIAEIISQRKS